MRAYASQFLRVHQPDALARDFSLETSLKSTVMYGAMAYLVTRWD